MFVKVSHRLFLGELLIETIPFNGLNPSNDLLRIRVDTQKNQTEDGEKSHSTSSSFLNVRVMVKFPFSSKNSDSIHLIRRHCLSRRELVASDRVTRD